MVVFTCSQCGDSVKKNAVERHLLRRKCRGAALCCIDCLKDFYGNEYKAHVSCVTENERYGGKNFLPKPGVNKGQLKQQQWFEKVLDAIEKGKGKHPPWMQQQFERLKGYPNIPNKRAKFEAFLMNNLGMKDRTRASKIWEAIDQNIEKQVPTTNQQASQNGDSATKQIEENKNLSEQNVLDTAIEQKTETEKKQSKRERKEERRKQAHKKEKKDQDLQFVNGDSTEAGKKKKKKHKDEEESEESKENSVRKKRKFEDIGESVCNGNEEEDDADLDKTAEETLEPVEEEEPAKKRFKTNFDWSGVILEVLQGKDTEMKIKKLRKKVLAEYLAQGCTEKSEEKLWAKFDKKLKKNPLIKIQNDRVKLKK